ncbi:MAG: hypothetical protein ACXV8Q_02815 [Methylobacter sp.]
MKKLVLKLDDIGREAHGPIFNIISWAMSKKLPLSIGTIGIDLPPMPTEVVDLIKLAVRLGFVELWNHGQRHIRYDRISDAEIISDLKAGHAAILDTFGVEPVGFGFPFNQYSEQALNLVTENYPYYFIYEVDFPEFRLLSPEFNSLADGQPRFSYFKDRIAQSVNASSNIIIQAHPPRWTNAGIDDFIECVTHLVENEGFVCLSARDASIIDAPIRENGGQHGAVWKIAAGKKLLVDRWENSGVEYDKTLSNFNSYFLPRFKADAERNYIQTSRAIYPFKPRRVLDQGCGLGNWSLPFWFAGSCQQLILNDVNQTIVDALRQGLHDDPATKNVIVDDRNLLADPGHGYKVDLLVSANTFNYLDPIDFFKFAQSCLVPGGRLLLMIQTEAFNKLRYRLASTSKDRAVAAEVLSSDFAMLLRRDYSLFPNNVRHVFKISEIVKLAVMFDLSLECEFSPAGEQLENGEIVYQCLVFKRTSGMKDAIVAREEWLTECVESMQHSFGFRSLKEAGFPDYQESLYFSYDQEWILPSIINNSDKEIILEIKSAIQSIRNGSIPAQIKGTSAFSQNHDFSGLVRGVNSFIDLIQ